MNTTIIIIAITVIVSIICFRDRAKFQKLAYIPYVISRNFRSDFYRFISHGFVHSNVPHLAFNMLTFYFFGPILEDIMGISTEFIFFYLSALIVASLPAYAKNRDNPRYIAVGASGAVSAVLMSLVLYAPWQKLYINFFIPVYYVLYAVFFFIYSAYMNKKETDNIAHDAHLAGALYGLVYMLIAHPESGRIFLEQIQNPPFLN